MTSLADRFRRWYEYERDCNAKSLEMLASVPVERRGAPEFQKAVDKMAHLVSARRRWLHRLGRWPETPPLFPPGTALADLTAQVADTEAEWVAYLSRLDEGELARELEWEAADGHRYRWDIEGILTQTFGHAWYHRGQIAHLVAALGGTAVDTDYILWCKLPQLDAPAP
ncbi:DinB family protein [Gemmata sp. G18]|uniref:DinB family protein n=1 Tax=Gemmata palustris TaxID=2822762 RepID=A0ABS5BRD8_9BACT|nr:DinB family protein [Gemmata palustris]MBP3956254.1 DinB family protein [Gemmata palustris]